MQKKCLYKIVLLAILPHIAHGQADVVPPASPLLDLVTVNRVTGYTELTWVRSTSPDVSGYVVYEYYDDAGHAIDTVRNPSAASYTHASLISSEIPRSYVVAAIDSAGNISTLSNILNTIHVTSQLDSCNGRIEIRWNGYRSYPKEVTGYTILYTLDEGPVTEAGRVPAATDRYSVSNYTFNARYCFFVRAELSGGSASYSNKRCISTRMQRPPQWINADFATITTEDELLLSFTIDPESETDTYVLERKSGTQGIFSQINRFSGKSGSLLYTDKGADLSKINYYRLSAVNNCSIPVLYSNMASSMVLGLSVENDIIGLMWNPYLDWAGGVAAYTILVNTGSGFADRYNLLPEDTIFTLRYSDIMYEVANDEVCFIVEASEGSNPYTVPGESRSSAECTGTIEVITVPNLFTPDNNLVNDHFIPVLSFTPAGYHLMVTDLKRRKVFESSNYTQPWDGTNAGVPVSEGTYIWFLELMTPSGRRVTKTGTVSVYRQVE